ncbi:hypothetical protein ACFYU8_29915 [Brevibacillus sp. NPDC003359]|uniref:hypothetical protein n=1 Tax=unclassified Brevibacillus TaxID=2684853 RepID=UPI0036AA626C
MDIDFAEFEKKLLQQFRSTMDDSEKNADANALADLISSVAVKVATMAIKEYHENISLHQVSQQKN